MGEDRGVPAAPARHESAAAGSVLATTVADAIVDRHAKGSKKYCVQRDIMIISKEENNRR